ncbi:MAG: RNA 2',3'-cyclic phosphodiesterase [Gammaproteobacteria bacterium]
MTQSDSRRLFFALWPSDEVRERIAQAFKRAPQSSMNGRKVAPSNYHITLHFIGNVGPEQQQCLHLAAQSVVADGFQLTLDRFGHFYKPRVFWFGCQHVPQALEQFQKQLGEALSRCDYQPDARVYAPHVTVMRKLIRPGELSTAAEIQWDVSEFVLVESKSTAEGVQYEAIEHYPLK